MTGVQTCALPIFSAEIAKAVRAQDVSQRFLQLGIEPVGSTPERYGTMIRAAYDRYAQVVKMSGAKAE